MRLDELVDVTMDRHLMNTSEAYSPVPYFFGSTCIIPFVSLDIIEQSVLGNMSRTSVELAHMIFINVSVIEWGGNIGGTDFYGQKKLSDLSSPIVDWFMAGECEIKVQFEKMLINIPQESRYKTTSGEGENMWFPIDTPYYKRNMELSRVKDFFSLQLFNEQLFSLLNIEMSGLEPLQYVASSLDFGRIISENWGNDKMAAL